MTSRKTNPTDDEIEAEVLNTRNDSSRWEALPAVPPSFSERPDWMLRNRHLDLSAKFHVLSMLHRLGAEANLSFAQPDSVDISVIGKDGKVITLDVKTLKKDQAWPVGQFRARKHHFLVFVEFASDEGNPTAPPRAYIVDSESLRRYLSRRKVASVPVSVLRKEFAAREAWQVIVAERAA